MDHGAFRVRSRERWERAANGWAARRDPFSRATAPVSAWLVEAVGAAPGKTLLELAAGPGEVGLLAAERVRPGGHVIITDGAEAMVDAVKARAAELGLDEVVVARSMEAEWIDLATANVDGVLCRWGYMLLADPEAALRETRRVLRPGGIVALAVWAAPEDNPWAVAAAGELRKLGLVEAPAPDEPGPFVLADPAALRTLLEDAGFAEIVIDSVAFTFTFADGDDYFETQRDCSPTLREVLPGLSPADHTRLRDAIDARLEPFTRPDGSVELPARTLVARAEA